ncbi:MFS transporter [soil metagenome]
MPTNDTPALRGWATLKLLTPYQWFVFIVCCLAWDLDCMDQQLFVLARQPAMEELVVRVNDKDSRIPDLTSKMSELASKESKPAPTVTAVIAKLQEGDIKEAGGYATALFMIGWAVGGIGFGIMGDRVGRVKTLTLTILLYSLFTGLSAFSSSTTDFFLYRFLTGLGVGGVFAAAVTLLAETLPDAARPYALGLFQASSVLGNCTAAGINIGLGYAVFQDAFKGITLLGFTLSPWRLMFLIGILPGLLVVLVQLRLKEPEKWLKLKAEGKKGGSYGEMLGNPLYRKHAIFGLILAVAGVVGLWGIAFFAPDLQRSVSLPVYQQEAKAMNLTGEDATRYIRWQGNLWSGVTSLVQNAGAILGIFAFSIATARVGRKPTFAFFFVAAGLSTAMVFLFLKQWSDIFWMVPIMGFFQLAIFGGYAIYFPELFPTRLRSTGTSFCYNVGRLVSAFGPAALGLLTSKVYNGYEGADPFRYAGVTMCLVFLVGLIALPFLPETKGKPLPE